MSFEQRLQEAAQLIGQRLERLCTDLETQGVPQRLSKAMRHGLLAGGKRFRPFLVIESAALFNVPVRCALETATAIECIHCYSLIHDDLPAMDNDKLRRGKSTVWSAYDEWTAILVGDALQAHAFEILVSKTTHDDPQIRNHLVAGLARASGGIGMVGGQALDLEAGKRNSPARPTPSYIKTMQSMKTGALIRFSCQAGAILAGKNASRDDCESLTTFGDHLGYAFQISDDLLDARGDDQTMGKAAHKDSQAGKATLVTTLGITKSRASLKVVHAQAQAALGRFGKKADTLRQAVDFVVNRKS